MPDALPFDLPFTEASKYFARKVPLSREEFDVLSDWAKQRAFTVATVTKASILSDLMDATQRAIDDGISLGEFQAALDDVMASTGWLGTTAWHAETIFRTNVQQAYGSGRLEQQQQQADDFPYWLFVAVLDDRTTDECEELNGTVFSIDDTTWYPPIDFNCRSSAESLTQAEAEEMGIDGPPDLQQNDFVGPGGGDEYDPDLSNLDDALATIVQDELDAFDPANVED